MKILCLYQALRLHRHSPTDPLCIFRAQVAARVILLDKAELSLRRGSATFGHSMATVVQLSEGFTRISMIFNGNEDEMKCFLSSPCGNMCQSISVTHRSGNADGVATTSLHIYILGAISVLIEHFCSVSWCCGFFNDVQWYCSDAWCLKMTLNPGKGWETKNNLKKDMDIAGMGTPKRFSFPFEWCTNLLFHSLFAGPRPMLACQESVTPAERRESLSRRDCGDGFCGRPETSNKNKSPPV